jgi:hypothetical protein
VHDRSSGPGGIVKEAKRHEAGKGGKDMSATTARGAKVGPVGRLGQASLALAAGALLALAGCESAPVTLDDDPLRGGGKPLALDAPTTPGARGSAAAEAPAVAVAGGLPALPPAQGPTSPAALVGNPGAAPPRPAREAETGVTLGGPRAAGGATITPTSGVAQPVGMQAAGGSYEALQQQLLARGVTWQQLKTGTAPDEWHFVCSVPHPEQNNIERQYEARAVGAGGLAAIRAVIQEIDKDRTGQ